MKNTKVPPKSAGKADPPLPEGAKNVPGSKREAQLKGAPHAKRVEIGKEFVSNPKGGAPLVLGKGKTLQVKGTPHTPR